jgi:hypothetical protein
MTFGTSSARSRQFGLAGGTGVCAFLLVCASAQMLRTDLDWLRAPLSFYLIGPHALWVRGAYFALATALLALGVGYYRALSPRARSAAPLLLFACGSLGLVVTALAETNTYLSPPTLEGFIHGVAAQTAFLCTTTAMLLQSWRLREDPLWRPRFVAAFALAAFCFIALWVQTLWRDVPRGLTQKLLILAILYWLGLAASWLRKSPAPRAAAAPLAMDAVSR